MKKKMIFSGSPGKYHLLKYLFIMKLTTVIILTTCLQVSAGVFSPSKISLNMQSADIKKVLSAIEKKSDYRFLYKQTLLNAQGKVSITATEEDVISVLTRLFKNTAVSFELLEHNLVVLKAQNTNIVRATITGKVTNTAGEPVHGASIRVKGSDAGTTTDSSGNFSITVPDGAVLVISYVGYADQEVATAGKTTIDVVLAEGSKELEQVVVVGYGTQRKIDVTGSVATVRGEDISKQSSINPISGLQGRVAGVQITNSGAPGASPQIRIRGLGTVYGSANPLYVVDGVWFDDISFLNPSDIESMNILKDASSEAIYGIRAANGVVLISTKKGKSGKAVVNYTGHVGVQMVTNRVDLANANEYAILSNEKAKINGGSDVLNPDNFQEGTDWYNVILRDALITNHQVSVSGGGGKSTYNLSLGYLKQDGNVEGNTFNRFTGRFQNDFQILDNLKVGYTITATGIDSRDINGNIFYQAFIAPPVIPVKYSDGSYGDPGDYPTGNFSNPQVTLDFFNQRSKTYRLTGNVFAELKILKELTFRTSLGGEYGEGEVLGYAPAYYATTIQNNNVSKLTVSRADTRNWIIENTLTYTKRFGDHNLTVLAGQGAQRYKSYKITGTAQNVPYTSRGDLYLRLGSTGTSTATDEGDLSTIASYFGRVNYAFQNKYLLTASLRGDGSSKFFGSERWGYFPSVGVGWVISEEEFMSNQKIFDNLKLRGSWGKVGNAAVPSNLSILTVTQTPQLSAFFGQPSVPATGASVNSIVPPTTYWERGVGTDIGLEMAFLDSRLYVEAGFYNRKTEQAIFDLPVLGSIGTGSGNIIANQATFQNQGYELTVNWKDNINKDISYSLGANFSINDNKVLSTTTGANPIYAGGAGTVAGNSTTRTVVGQPIGQFFGYQVLGIFQNQAQINSTVHVPNAKLGDFIFADITGSQGKPDGQINALDRVVLGNPNPRFNFGLNTNWTYKSFDLMLDFQGVADVEVYNGTQNVRYGNENYTKEFYDKRWRGEGSSNSFPSANTTGNNLDPSAYYVEDASYLRIRNAQLGYTLPTALTNRWRINRFRVYVNAQNPVNWFKYSGFSPEVGGTPTNAGIDINVYPLYATYNFGVNVTF
jgi:TonB-linked SusC/RagA family outer membrane protein